MSAITKSLLLANVTWPLSYSNRWIVLYSSPRVVRECLGGGVMVMQGRGGWGGTSHFHQTNMEMLFKDKN